MKYIKIFNEWPLSRRIHIRASSWYVPNTLQRQQVLLMDCPWTCKRCLYLYLFQFCHILYQDVTPDKVRIPVFVVVIAAFIVSIFANAHQGIYT